MMWLTWRQFRMQTIIAVVVLGALAIALAVTGPELVHLYDNVLHCAAQGDCPEASRALGTQDAFLRNLLDLGMLAVPVILGIFWGAPLIARELEAGTFRFAWTQSVSRGRWLLVKLGVLGLASMATAGLFSLMVTWWFDPVDKFNANRFSPGTFDERALVPLGYAAFAFALGVTLGLVMRHVVPAMAATLAAFIVIRIVFTNWIRPHLISPVHQSFPVSQAVVGLGSSNGSAPSLQAAIPPSAHAQNAWVYSTEIVDKAGHALTNGQLQAACPQLFNGPNLGPPATVAPVVHNSLTACAQKLAPAYHMVATYQPGSRFWAFQWYETGIYVAAALILAGFSFWWLRRRGG